MKLTPKKISLDNLLLDPNNPRFADISDESLNIPQIKYAEEKVQKNAYDKMMHPRFDVQSLASSIETVGFYNVDNIVARDIDNGNFVVVEGNRRTTAIKYLINQYDLGQSVLDEETILKLKSIDILVIEGQIDDVEEVGKVIQGIRNVSGIKEWDAYQKAQYINDLIGKGKSPATISKMIGMSVREINRYYKTFSVMSQFKKDEEYSSYWKHSFFSHFDEVLKRPALRSFMGWNDETYLFENQENTRRFYEWLAPDEDGKVALSDAHNVRQLVHLVAEPVALNYLDDKNLQKAMNYIEQKNFNAQKITLPECMGKISNAIEAFKNIVAEGLEAEMSNEEVADLKKSVHEMKNQLDRIAVLKQADVV
ncbi:ParB/Srx family N-terminal domain-containing protein [Zunongwangia profunda]|jgi:hypothetical protein|uniref:ParB/Srx family N-terminal domain-containing protein n=1 Tax=Zunongwangia profunda TaxID=398743 RepID=UPI001D180C32|nr:ParB/Srx family N-terminal domain-containing protein [Zunongwangia profunda]MCC4229057.1 ParB/Srx family N-terminal domain-containing protein [Zunongwangia profunda]